jgi:hypothetical protein
VIFETGTSRSWPNVTVKSQDLGRSDVGGRRNTRRGFYDYRGDKPVPTR